MIDAAIWHAFDAESAYGEYDDTEAEQGVAATTTANQAIAPKPAGIRTTQQPTQKPVKKLTPKQLSDIKTLDHKQLLNYIKTNLKAPTTTAPKPAIPIRPNLNSTPATTNNSQVPNPSFDTVNAKNDDAKNKDGESDRLA
jgi:hypothetical protein